MLVLSRKAGESIVIGEGITIVVNRISGNRVAIGIDAPDSQRIVRGELIAAVDAFAEEEDKQAVPAFASAAVAMPHQLELAAGSVT